MIKKIFLQNPFQLFLTILLPFVLSVSLIIIIQSTLLYKNFESLALDMIYSQQKASLKNLSHNVSMMEQTAKTISTSAYFDSIINDIMHTDINPVDYQKYINKILYYKALYPFLQSIYVYNGQKIYAEPSNAFIYDNATFQDHDIFRILGDMQNYKTHNIVPRKVPNITYGLSENESKSNYVYSYLFYDSQMQSGKVSDAIILNISEEWIKQSISDTNNQNSTRVFIIDSSGKLISDDFNHPLLTDLSHNEYFAAMKTSRLPMGNLRMNVDGVDSFITYTSTDVFNWNLVSITPYNDIVNKIVDMRTKTYIFVFFILLLTIIILFYISGRIYIPVNSVIHNLNKLEAEKQNEFYSRKQDFLRSMVNHIENSNFESFIEQFSKFNISLVPSDNLLLVLARIDNFGSFCKRFNFNYRSTFKYSMINIICEQLSPLYKTEYIEIDADQILVLINYSSSELPSLNEPLVAIFKEIQNNIEIFLNVSLSFTFGDVFSSLNSLNEKYKNLLDLSYYRLIFGHKSLIFNETVKIKTQEFKYPYEKDKLLTEALILDHTIDAKNTFLELIQYASEYSFTAFNSTLLRVLLSINTAIELINSNNDLQINYNFNIYLSQLQKFETLDEIETIFFDLFESISCSMELKKDNKYTKLIDDVVSIINSKYTDPNLSLDSLSEMVNLSPSYLGRLFKKHSSISISDYINNVRLEKSKSLLSASEQSINTIMDKSGFISRSHFFTLFKKMYGVTPNQYRKNASTDVSDK